MSRSKAAVIHKLAEEGRGMLEWTKHTLLASVSAMLLSCFLVLVFDNFFPQMPQLEADATWNCLGLKGEE